LGIGDWAQSPIPNPQSPIPNPHFVYDNLFLNLLLINNFLILKFVFIFFYENIANKTWEPIIILK